MDPFAPAPPPSTAAVKSARDLYDKLKARSPDLAADFDKKYDAWKKTWVSNNDSPNSDTRATGPEFDALIALGPKIMPFVVNRLTSGKDFTAVVLYDKLEANACYVLEPEDILNSKVLQCQSRSGSQLSTASHTQSLLTIRQIMQVAASDIINMSFHRSTDLKDALDAWAEFRVQRQNYSSSFHFTEGEGYWGLVDLGPSIIAPVMLEYYNDRGGWWHELLHELVHGQVSGAGVFFKSVVFESWKDWFEHKNHEDAPKGMDERARVEHGYDRLGGIGRLRPL